LSPSCRRAGTWRQRRKSRDGQRVDERRAAGVASRRAGGLDDVSELGLELLLRSLLVLVRVRRCWVCAAALPRRDLPTALGPPAEPSDAATGKRESAVPGEPLLVAGLGWNRSGSMMAGETAESWSSRPPASVAARRDSRWLAQWGPPSGPGCSPRSSRPARRRTGKGRRDGGRAAVCWPRGQRRTAVHRAGGPCVPARRIGYQPAGGFSEAFSREVTPNRPN
jgi:hypothetical protein